MRQAFAGMLWSKQLYDYDVARWLDGDPTQPAPPASRADGRNSRWRNFDAFDIMSMPDKWEYPWFAAWDLAFHCVALAHVDPAFAKYQLLLICREWFQHPNGALPAYEWDFGDVNPPVQAWAALEVFAIDGGRDLDFLSRVFDKLLVNFTWWVNREDADGSNLFEGGFLGLDNIGPIDRSHLPGRRHARAVRRHRLDGVLRAGHGRHRGDPQPLGPAAGDRPRAQVPRALRRDPPGDGHLGRVGRDRRPVLRQAGHARRDRGAGQGALDGRRSSRCWPPSCIDEEVLDRAETVGKQFARLLDAAGRHAEEPGRAGPGARRARRPAAAARRRRRRAAAPAVRQAVRRARVPVAVRPAGPVRLPPRPPVRARGRGHPGDDRLRAGRVDDGDVRRQLQLARARSGSRSTTCVVTALERYHRFFGDELTVEYPTGSGTGCTLDQIAEDLRRRLVDSSWSGRTGGGRASGGSSACSATRRGRTTCVFNEYFHGDNGAGLGAIAPDRLDRRRRRPHPRPARRRRLRRRRPRRGARANGPADDRAPSARPGRGCARAAASRSARRRSPAAPTSPSPSDVADGMLLCLFDDAGAETQVAAARLRRRRLARLRRRRRARPGVRLPRARPVRPGPRRALQPGQAAARPVRPGHHRRGARSARRSSATTPTTPTGPARSTRPATCPAAWSSTPPSTGATRPPARRSLRRHRHLRGPRQGLHDGPPRRARRAARHLRRPRPTTPPSPTSSTSA